MQLGIKVEQFLRRSGERNTVGFTGGGAGGLSHRGKFYAGRKLRARSDGRRLDSHSREGARSVHGRSQNRINSDLRHREFFARKGYG